MLVALIFLFCVAVPLAWLAWQYFVRPGRLAFASVTYGTATAAILLFGWAAHAPPAYLLIAFACLALGALRMQLLWPLQIWALRRRLRGRETSPPPDAD
jgi:hypothetical protein